VKRIDSARFDSAHRVGRQERFVNSQGVVVEADELNLLDPARFNVAAHGSDGNDGSAIGRKTVDASADGGKRNGPDSVFASEFETPPITGCEPFVFVAISSVPNRTHGMEYPPGGQLKAGCGFGVSSGATVQPAAGFEQFRTCGTVDGAINAATAEQRGIGRVHNCIHGKPGDIARNGYELRH
jgi:hypothetical protein